MSILEQNFQNKPNYSLTRKGASFRDIEDADENAPYRTYIYLKNQSGDNIACLNVVIKDKYENGLLVNNLESFLPPPKKLTILELKLLFHELVKLMKEKKLNRIFFHPNKKIAKIIRDMNPSFHPFINIWKNLQKFKPLNSIELGKLEELLK